MSDTPTPRLGRAVRYLAPVAAVAVLAVPSAALAGNGNGNANGNVAKANGNASNAKSNGDEGKASNGNGHTPGLGNAGPDNGKEHGSGNDADGPDRNNGAGNDRGADKPGNGPKDPKPGNGPKDPKPGNGPKDPKPGNGPKDRDRGGSDDAAPVVQQSAPSSAPASAPVSTTIASRVPVACSSRRLVTITLGRASAVRASSARINGKKVKVTNRHGRLVTTVDLRRLAKGTYTVTTEIVSRSTTIKTTTVRRYRTCTPKPKTARRTAKTHRAAKARRS